MPSDLVCSWIDDQSLKVFISGDFNLNENFDKRKKIIEQIKGENVKNISIDANSIGKWDSTILVLFIKIINISKEKNINLNLSNVPSGVQKLIDLAFSVEKRTIDKKVNKDGFFEKVGQYTLGVYGSFKSSVFFLGDVCTSLKNFFLSRAIMRKIDLFFALEDCSYKALPIVALISFMVGLIFAFVGSVQLKMFGAEIYVASLVAIAMVRVMGAIMTGIIMAGRTGSSYAATIGTMQVNEEIDALKTMGVPVVDFLLLPRMISLMLMMPLLTIFADIVGMLGGAAVGIFMLDLSPTEYWNTSINTLNFTHFIVGIIHGFVFGCIIAICGCYYGIKCGKDADSVGKATTNAVVYSIIWIIVATAIITIICQVLKV